MDATAQTTAQGRSAPGGPGPGPRRSLDDEVQYVKGVGPSFAAVLGKLGIRTAGDLLRHIPRRYEDRTHFRRIGDLRPGEQATVRGKVVAVETSASNRRNLAISRVVLDDGTGVAQLIFFGQPYLQKVFDKLASGGRSIVVYGLAKRAGFGPIEIERAEWEELADEGDGLSTNRIVPIYPATEGIGQQRLRRIIDSVLKSHLSAVEEVLPGEVVAAHGLCDPHYAYRNVHYPESWEAIDRAHRRLVFEEFFLLQLGLARRRASNRVEAHGPVFRVDPQRFHRDLAQILPFELTKAQKRAVDDVIADVTSGRAMNRLIQGDVGSGKTVVALAAMLLAVENGYQAALMAPTEILAQQHAIVLRRLLEPLALDVELAVGGRGARQREALLKRVASGASRIVVGTHALIEEDVVFDRLGLAVIDEQHRFGVLQRQALYRKAERPHVLIMTATPIPRTLTLTIYGDLDTTVIDELPPGRKPIKTHWKPKREAPAVYAAMRRLLDQGRQAYIVCPLVEESEKLQVQAATQLAERVRKEILPGYRIGLLHGQMRPDEKDEAMRQFKAHEIDVLVSTTVIEVGVDVPNACVMVVEDADRFGLAQLHQLRGRVGRGEHASFCILLADPKTEDGAARMMAMVETQDGFRIAEEDLRLRGPGEFFGTRQSGLPEFSFGDILRDFALMDEARRAAFAMVEADPNLSRPEAAALRRALARSRFGFELVHVS